MGGGGREGGVPGGGGGGAPPRPGGGGGEGGGGGGGPPVLRLGVQEAEVMLAVPEVDALPLLAGEGAEHGRGVQRPGVRQEACDRRPQSRDGVAVAEVGGGHQVRRGG